MEMNIQEYIKQKKELYSFLISFIESKSSDIVEYEALIDFIDNQKISEDKNELRLLLHLILQISKHHYRHTDFLSQIEKIILKYENNIKQTFSNNDLFDIFKSNKILLLFLFEKKIITIDQFIINYLIKKSDTNHDHYFYPEIKDHLNKKQRELIEKSFDPSIQTNFEEFRHKGENHFYISNLIRNDMIEEFVAHVNRNNLPLSSRINPSIFETNSFLIKKSPSLIEYSAFYGSIQIFQYLNLNKVKLEPSLWLYAIHGKNADIIHLLEENNVEPKEYDDDENYQKFQKEAIKCHHNDIANYIKEQFLDDEFEKFQIMMQFDDNPVAFGYRYYNFNYVELDLNNIFNFYYACEYDYMKIVQLLIETQKIDVNKPAI